MSEPLAPGMVIASRYRLDRLLGEGGVGRVWAATHTVTLQRVAIKVLKECVQRDAETRRRFLREASTASAVAHPNVVPVRDFFELEDGAPVMVMDLLEGETLRQKLARESALSLKDTVDIMLPVISAVGTAHSLGVAHRDLKPDNVFLVSPEGGTGAPGGKPDVRVLDFGIAKLFGAHASSAIADLGTATEAGTLLGTPAYMSPEQGFGERDIDHRADVWAIGIMLYEALSGSRPVDGENAGQVLKRLLHQGIAPLDVVAPDVPKDVAQLVDKMLSRDRDERPADLREVHATLERHGSASVQRFGAAVGEHEGSAPLGGVESAAVVAPEPVERRGFRRGPLFVGIVASAALLSGFLAAQRTATPRREPIAEVVQPRVTLPPVATVDVAPIPRLAPDPAREAVASGTMRPGASKRPVERTRRPRPKVETSASVTNTNTSRGLVDEPPF